MKLIINGNVHYINDMFSAYLSQAYKSRQSQIRDKLIQDLKDKGAGNPSVTVPDNVTAISFLQNTPSIGGLQVLISRFTCVFQKGACNITMKFDIKISANVVFELKNNAYTINLKNTTARVSQLWVQGKPRRWYQFWNYVYCPIVAEFINIINSFSPYKESFSDYSYPVFAFGKYNELGVEALQKNPIRISFSTYGNEDLSLGFYFMEGTEANPTRFQSIQPSITPSQSFEYLGFGCPYYSFQKASDGWNDNKKPDGNPMEYYNVLLQSMKTYGTASVRVCFPWGDIFGDGRIPINFGNTVSALTPSELNRLISSIPEAYWVGMDSIIARSQRYGFDVIPQLLQQAKDRPLMDGGYIVPDSVRRTETTWVNGTPYRFVDAETYLYYAKIFAHAVVRRYRNDVAIWALESELNAARLLSLYGWMPGNLWKDESNGGFQSRLWQILVKAVRDEDATAKIMTNFHLLNIVQGLERFGQDLDIVGVDVYPNVKFAEPIAGFMVGEVVWATRRALQGLNMTNKIIHVAETAYPGIVNDDNYDPPSNLSLSERLTWYSYGRQSKFLEDAMRYSLAYGAKGFFYWGFLDTDTANNWRSGL